MKDSWVKSRDNEAESDILDKVFDNYDMFDFKGALLRVNGKVVPTLPVATIRKSARTFGLNK